MLLGNSDEASVDDTVSITSSVVTIIGVLGVAV